MTTPTHTAQRPHVGYVHRGRGFGHTTRRLGKVHACTVDGHKAYPICGEPPIRLVEEDYDTGDPITWHVTECAAFGIGGYGGVTCDRCKRAI